MLTEAVIPGTAPPPPIFVAPEENIFLWHFMFNQLADLPETLTGGVSGSILAISSTAGPIGAIGWRRRCISLLTQRRAACAPDSTITGRSGDRAAKPPARRHAPDDAGVDGGAEHATGDAPLTTLRGNAHDLRGETVAGCGHFITEECHEEFIALITPFGRRTPCRSMNALPLFDGIGRCAAPASLAEMRAATETGLRRLQGEAEPSGGVRDYTVIAADGYRIALRAYLPARENCAAAQPAMLFAHGGGWCLGSLALYDRPCQALANATGRVILSVDYRLAPEYPFPQPLEDVYQALCWVAQQAPQLRIDAQRGGGRRQRRGNLAAAVALLARDRGGPHIERQLLLYPALSREMATTSYREFAEGTF